MPLYETYLYVDSGTRNVAAWPQVSNFRYHFTTQIRSVVAVEVLGAVIPVSGTVASQPYIVLDVAELNHLEVGPQRFSAFAVLQLPGPISAGSTWVNLDKKASERSPAHFKTPCTLSSLTFRFCDRNGTTMDLGVDDASSVLTSPQSLVALKVTYSEPTV